MKRLTATAALLVIVSVPFLAPAEARGADHPDRACFAWLQEFVSAKEATIGRPEILPYGPDPKIRMLPNGDIEADRTVADVASAVKSGNLTYTEISRTSVQPAVSAPGAESYFNLKIYRNSSNRLVRAEIRSPQHNHGAVDKYEDYVVEFETTNSACSVKRALGDVAWNPIPTPYSAGAMHVIADRDACRSWLSHWGTHSKAAKANLKNANTADSKWIDRWKAKSAPWLAESDNESIPEAMKEQCEPIAQFLASPKDSRATARAAKREGSGGSAGTLD